MSTNPNPAPVDRVSEVRQAVVSLGVLLAEVQANVDTGIDIDLAGLAETTAAICNEVEALPAGDARTMVAELSVLVETCEAIASTVAQRLAGQAATL